MEESFIKGPFSFVIRGEELELDEIIVNIKIKPSKVRKKNVSVTKRK